MMWQMGLSPMPTKSKFRIELLEETSQAAYLLLNWLKTNIPRVLPTFKNILDGCRLLLSIQDQLAQIEVEATSYQVAHDLGWMAGLH